MNKKYIFLLPLLLIITLSSDSSATYNKNKQIKILEQSAFQIIEKHYLLNLFSNPRFSIDNRTIYIELDIDRKISNMATIEQFMNFKMFTQKLRVILNNHSNKKANFLSRKDVIIYGKFDENTFVYDSILPNKNLILSYESYFSINKKIIFSSSEFKRVTNQHISNTSIEKVNGYDDIDVHRYARRLFTLITKNGKYYNPDQDDPLIVEATCDKFNLTAEELADIDNKYYLFPTFPY
ncbi:hypothetical protein [Bacillus massiliigorillae]|uniref:hypothetical protein n=1 Tax=Bacillus massiliigorillae TaxID=1243664 RepID=UPI0003A172BC|nr:hypothetical protein [Bacillus massiliigorillae]